MRVTLPFVLIIPGVKTAAGNVYTKEVLNSILAQIQSRLPWYGSLAHPEDGRSRIADISHTTHSLQRSGFEILCEVELLDTPKGKMAQALYNNNAPMCLAPLMLGSRDDDGTLGTDVRVKSLDIILPAKEMSTTLDTIVQAVFAEE